MSLVRSFGAKPPSDIPRVRVTERVVRDNRLVATVGQVMPREQAEELGLPFEELPAAGVRTAAVAAPDSSSRTPAPEPERESACPTCGASGDDPCVTTSGNEAAKRHAGRDE